MNVKAELVWIEELQRRQDAHIEAVWKRLKSLPVDACVALRHGPRHKVTGKIEDVSQDLLQLRLSEARTKLVPLVQAEAIDGVEVPTVVRLERPRVDGVARVEAGPGAHEAQAGTPEETAGQARGAGGAKGSKSRKSSRMC